MGIIKILDKKYFMSTQGHPILLILTRYPASWPAHFATSERKKVHNIHLFPSYLGVEVMEQILSGLFDLTINNCLGNCDPECVGHHTDIRWYIWTDPPKMCICVTIIPYWITRWFSLSSTAWRRWVSAVCRPTYLSFLGEFSKKIDCQVRRLHIHQSYNRFFTFLTEFFQCFISSTSKSSLKWWKPP